MFSCSLPERDSGFLAFVGQDFAVGQAGVVIDGVVQVAATDLAFPVVAQRFSWRSGPVAGSCAAPDSAVSTAVRDVAEFLDIDVDQVARRGVFVAADRCRGGPVEPAQPGHAIAGQDPVHGGGVQSEQVGDAGRSPPAQEADFDDAAFGARGCAVRAVVRTAGPVAHRGGAGGAVPVGPPFRGGRRDLESFRGSAQWPSVVDDAPSQP
ncbi:hypothetical protein B7C42_08313 [Nocardia cerradoensis]|uniref:Uncharacterized protein n=1 Tax=Nocardia cerradoensis TaxID=85688 RepID=A0A231GSL8_9NOCA|nr:hypothetical protein B7C42_08313 [Nocardia cerradoensis]